MLRVYISGPITLGGFDLNIGLAVDAANELANHGFAPFCPHSNTFLMAVKQRRPHAEWLALDLPWVDACDVIYRIPGASKGADMEVARARKQGIPVVYSIGELITLRDGRLHA
jgi:hypothetical protein